MIGSASPSPASYVDEPYQSQEFNAWGYANVNGNALIGGSKSFVTSTQLKRFGINGTIQAKPTDEVTFTFDGFYSNFKDDQSKRGIEFPLGFDLCCGTGFNPAGATVEEGQYVTGTFTNAEGVIRNDIFEKQADLYSLGGNVAWNPGNGWKAFADVGWSRTTRNELSLESYSGTGYGNGVGASDTLAFQSGPTGTSFTPTLNYSDREPHPPDRSARLGRGARPGGLLQRSPDRGRADPVPRRARARIRKQLPQLGQGRAQLHRPRQVAEPR